MPQSTLSYENGEGEPWEPKPAHIPYILARSEHDEWEFFVGLRSGMVVRFTSATIRGDWVTLNDPVILSGPQLPRELYSNDRGLEVRIRDIVWCADQAS